MIIADTFGNIFLVATVIAVVAAVIGFWYVSQRAPRGAVLGIAVVIYVVGVALSITAQDPRLLNGISGVCKFVGFVGFLLGLVDLVRNKSAKQATSTPAMRAGLVRPVATSKSKSSPTPHEKLP
jgi:hypothetical protein